MNKRQWRKKHWRIHDFCVTNYEREGGYNIVGWNKEGDMVFPGYVEPFKTLDELDKFLRGITKVQIVDVSVEEEKRLWNTGDTDRYGLCFTKYLQDRINHGDYCVVTKNFGKIRKIHVRECKHYGY